MHVVVDVAEAPAAADRPAGAVRRRVAVDPADRGVGAVELRPRHDLGGVLGLAQASFMNASPVRSV